MSLRWWERFTPRLPVSRACLDEGQSPDQSENNINDINMLAFYHLIRWNLGCSRGLHRCLGSCFSPLSSLCSWQAVVCWLLHRGIITTNTVFLQRSRRSRRVLAKGPLEIADSHRIRGILDPCPPAAIVESDGGPSHQVGIEESLTGAPSRAAIKRHAFVRGDAPGAPLGS
jgi:hypothetical protein